MDNKWIVKKKNTRKVNKELQKNVKINNKNKFKMIKKSKKQKNK